MTTVDELRTLFKLADSGKISVVINGCHDIIYKENINKYVNYDLMISDRIELNIKGYNDMDGISPKTFSTIINNNHYIVYVSIGYIKSCITICENIKNQGNMIHDAAIDESKLAAALLLYYHAVEVFLKHVIIFNGKNASNSHNLNELYRLAEFKFKKSCSKNIDGSAVSITDKRGRFVNMSIGWRYLYEFNIDGDFMRAHVINCMANDLLCDIIDHCMMNNISV